MIDKVNKDPYSNIQKIEKIKKYPFVCKKPIIHKPLWFNLDGLTENDKVDDWNYTFLQIDDSLSDVSRISHRLKEPELPNDQFST